MFRGASSLGSLGEPRLEMKVIRVHIDVHIEIDMEIQIKVCITIIPWLVIIGNTNFKKTGYNGFTTTRHMSESVE